MFENPNTQAFERDAINQAPLQDLLTFLIDCPPRVIRFNLLVTNILYNATPTHNANYRRIYEAARQHALFGPLRKAGFPINPANRLHFEKTHRLSYKDSNTFDMVQAINEAGLRLDIPEDGKAALFNIIVREASPATTIVFKESHRSNPLFYNTDIGAALTMANDTPALLTAEAYQALFKAAQRFDRHTPSREQSALLDFARVALTHLPAFIGPQEKSALKRIITKEAPTKRGVVNHAFSY